MLQHKASARRDPAAKDVSITAAFVRAHCLVVAVASIPSPRFTSQLKDTLDTPVRDFGFSWTPDDKFVSALERSPLIERALEAARARQESVAAKLSKAGPAKRAPVIAKYDPAGELGKGKSTLLVCEGDSAKSFCTAGLGVIGRKHYGVYPIRGKLVNVRGMTPSAIVANKEAKEMMQILGLTYGVAHTAESARKLPYARLMIVSDQDVDGAHICGLIYNLVAVVAPSLLQAKPDFICRFATPLVRVNVPRTNGTLVFFAENEYDEWVARRRANGEGIGVAQYYKGLGSSSNALVKSYFRNLRELTITLAYGEASAESLDMMFHKARANDRKAAILASDLSAYVDYAQESISLERFVCDELVPQYGHASLTRAIPSVLDGFKESTRKIFFGMRELGAHHPTPVAQLAGRIWSRTDYHHGEASLCGTIVGLAQTYTGASNLPLLQPDGQFGTRYSFGSASAPRYINTNLDPVHALLFPPADDAVLAYTTSNGKSMEPVSYVPVVPWVLCHGARGIAMGWSTEVPLYNPLDVVDATLAYLEGRDALPALVPWVKGFAGTIRADGPEHFTVRGVCERRGADVVVTEVPPMREVDAYVEEWKVAEGLADAVKLGDAHADDRVHVTLQGCKDLGDDPAKALGLEKRLDGQHAPARRARRAAQVHRRRDRPRARRGAARSVRAPPRASAARVRGGARQGGAARALHRGQPRAPVRRARPRRRGGRGARGGRPPRRAGRRVHRTAQDATRLAHARPRGGPPPDVRGQAARAGHAARDAAARRVARGAGGAARARGGRVRVSSSSATGRRRSGCVRV